MPDSGNFTKPMEFTWAFFWEGRDGDYIHMERESVFGDGPGFQPGDEIEFVPDDGKRTALSARVVRRVFELNTASVRVYLRKLD
jgi:hypothetical protein